MIMMRRSVQGRAHGHRLPLSAFVLARSRRGTGFWAPWCEDLPGERGKPIVHMAPRSLPRLQSIEGGRLAHEQAPIRSVRTVARADAAQRHDGVVHQAVMARPNRPRIMPFTRAAACVATHLRERQTARCPNWYWSGHWPPNGGIFPFRRGSAR